ncbi:MAG: hypothetical protein M1826_001663 [Phylliscum demangeonii]|nr:MAG: hypothetical protein M1826_001663 [Phylliscum demangeonii]
MLFTLPNELLDIITQYAASDEADARAIRLVCKRLSRAGAALETIFGHLVVSVTPRSLENLQHIAQNKLLRRYVVALRFGQLLSPGSGPGRPGEQWGGPDAVYRWAAKDWPKHQPNDKDDPMVWHDWLVEEQNRLLYDEELALRLAISLPRLRRVSDMEFRWGAMKLPKDKHEGDESGQAQTYFVQVLRVVVLSKMRLRQLRAPDFVLGMSWAAEVAVVLGRLHTLNLELRADPWPGRDRCRGLYLNDSLQAATELEILGLWGLDPPRLVDCPHLFKTVHWPSLHTLHLATLRLNGRSLAAFFRRHSPRLSRLILREVCLRDVGEWVAVLMVLHHRCLISQACIQRPAKLLRQGEAPPVGNEVAEDEVAAGDARLGPPEIEVELGRYVTGGPWSKVVTDVLGDEPKSWAEPVTQDDESTSSGSE